MTWLQLSVLLLCITLTGMDICARLEQIAFELEQIAFEIKMHGIKGEA